MRYRITNTLIEIFLKIIIPALYGLIVAVYIVELNMSIWLICYLLAIVISYAVLSIVQFVKELRLIWRKDNSDEDSP